MSSISRSSNCSKYTDTLSVMVHGKATAGDDERCAYESWAFSCQTSAFEKPDDETREGMEATAKTELAARGCDTSAMQMTFETNLVGSHQTEYSAEKLAELGMASNCFAHGNDINDASHQIRSRCRPQYDMMDAKGNRVRDYNKVMVSNLITCDTSDAAMPQLMEDARKVAAHNASLNGYTVDKPEHLACDVAVLPFK